jgi:hypothetical protein
MRENTRSLPSLRLFDWLILFGAHWGLLFFNQLMEQILNQQMALSMKAESTSFALTAATQFLNGVSVIWMQSVVVMMLLQKYHPETAFSPLLTKLGDFTREWLRSMGKISLGMMALILPGLIRLIDYSLLPFVCFFDPAYQKGERDALKTCTSLAKGHRLKLWGLWLGLGLLVPLILTLMFGDYESLFETPVTATLLIALDAALQLFSVYLLWRIYLKTRPLS